MLSQELREKFLEVVLVTPEDDIRHSGHKIREAQKKNPDWYRDLWHSRSYVRKPKKRKGKRHKRRTGILSPIRRTSVESALQRIESGRDLAFRELAHTSAVPYTGWYDMTMREFIFQRAMEGFKDPEWGLVEPDPAMTAFFRARIEHLFQGSRKGLVAL